MFSTSSIGRSLTRLRAATPSLSQQATSLAQSGVTSLFVAVAGQVAGLIGVQDTVKSESRPAVEQVRALGLEVWVLSAWALAVSPG